MSAVERETWVDNVKVIACILVVLGHFFQGITNENILPRNDLFQWFNQTIYYFHVPLFFICSGYLYQTFSRVEDIHSWRRNTLKKVLNLGVPYFVFSFAKWFVKAILSDDGLSGLFDVWFLYPMPPYWYLYALFFLFLVTPTFRNKTMAVGGLVIAMLAKIIGMLAECDVKAISYILSHEIWFVIGMCISVWNIKAYIKKSMIIIPIVTGVVFGVLSVLIYKANMQHAMASFIMGLIACCSIIMMVMILFKGGKQVEVFAYLSKYTMPIFLMHTLFAAPVRIILLKAGIWNAAVHVVLGLLISFVGPIVAMAIISKSKRLEFFLYPGKFIKIG